MKNTFLLKENLAWFSGKCFFFFNFGWKKLSKICEKFKNIMLFVDYVKFGPQTFDCYIFCLNFFFFQIHPLKFDLIWFLY